MHTLSAVSTDVLQHIASYCDDTDFCALRLAVRGLPNDVHRSMRASARTISHFHEQWLRRPTPCLIPYCGDYAIRHVYWLSQQVYVPMLPYCLRHCALLRIIDTYDLLCVDEHNRVRFIGNGAQFVLGLPPAG